MLVKKLNREVGALRRDVQEIKKVVLEALIDREGTYHPAFVKKILGRAKEAPRRHYTTAADFLERIHGRGK